MDVTLEWWSLTIQILLAIHNCSKIRLKYNVRCDFSKNMQKGHKYEKKEKILIGFQRLFNPPSLEIAFLILILVKLS